MLISLLSSVKISTSSFVNDQLIFLKFEKSNTGTLFSDSLYYLWHSSSDHQRRSMGSFLYKNTDGDQNSLQALYRHISSPGLRANQNSYPVFCKPTFIAEILQDGWHTILLYPRQSMFSVRQDVFTIRVLFDSVLPLFGNTSSNSFLFHILFFLFNMIFRIQLKGALSELVWSHVFFTAFICSLFLKSQKQFLWYLKLDNFNSMLLFFHLLAAFLSSFTSLPPFLPSPPSLP